MTDQIQTVTEQYSIKLDKQRQDLSLQRSNLKETLARFEGIQHANGSQRQEIASANRQIAALSRQILRNLDARVNSIYDELSELAAMRAIEQRKLTKGDSQVRNIQILFAIEEREARLINLKRSLQIAKTLEKGYFGAGIAAFESRCQSLGHFDSISHDG
jgi:hypothetical protein